MNEPTNQEETCHQSKGMNTLSDRARHMDLANWIWGCDVPRQKTKCCFVAPAPPAYANVAQVMQPPALLNRICSAPGPKPSVTAMRLTDLLEPRLMSIHHAPAR